MRIPVPELALRAASCSRSARIALARLGVGKQSQPWPVPRRTGNGPAPCAVGSSSPLSASVRNRAGWQDLLRFARPASFRSPRLEVLGGWRLPRLPWKPGEIAAQVQDFFGRVNWLGRVGVRHAHPPLPPPAGNRTKPFLLWGTKKTVSRATLAELVDNLESFLLKWSTRLWISATRRATCAIPPRPPFFSIVSKPGFRRQRLHNCTGWDVATWRSTFSAPGRRHAHPRDALPESHCPISLHCASSSPGFTEIATDRKQKAWVSVPFAYSLFELHDHLAGLHAVALIHPLSRQFCPAMAQLILVSIFRLRAPAGRRLSCSFCPGWAVTLTTMPETGAAADFFLVHGRAVDWFRRQRAAGRASALEPRFKPPTLSGMAANVPAPPHPRQLRMSF